MEITDPVFLAELAVEAARYDLQLAQMEAANVRLACAYVARLARHQRDCRTEPRYPAHETAIFAISTPDMTCHHRNQYCGNEAPHPTSECSWWGNGK